MVVSRKETMKSKNLLKKRRVKIAQVKKKYKACKMILT